MAKAIQQIPFRWVHPKFEQSDPQCYFSTWVPIDYSLKIYHTLLVIDRTNCIYYILVAPQLLQRERTYKTSPVAEGGRAPFLRQAHLVDSSKGPDRSTLGGASRPASVGCAETLPVHKSTVRMIDFRET